MTEKAFQKKIFVRSVLLDSLDTLSSESRNEMLAFFSFSFFQPSHSVNWFNFTDFSLQRYNLPYTRHYGQYSGAVSNQERVIVASVCQSIWMICSLDLIDKRWRCRRDYLKTRDFIKTLGTIYSLQGFYKVPREYIKSLKLQ